MSQSAITLDIFAPGTLCVHCEQPLDRAGGECELHLEENQACIAVTHPGSFYDQPEYCDEEVQPGTEYCRAHEHHGLSQGDYYDLAYDAWKDAQIEREFV